LSSFRQAPKPHVAPFAGPAWPVAAAWLAAAILAQSTIVHYIAIRDVAPSLVLVVVVWYSIRVDARRAALYGLIAGFCEDALSAHSGAAWTISTCASAVLASLLSRGFFADSIPLAVGITLVATLVRALLFWMVVALFGYPPGLGSVHFHEAAAQSLFNAGVMIVAMLIARRLEVMPR
jgi:rod shape-determining protein MreD